eukprot:scaffold77153_cov38-Prasinocladus_malaysianus.AAC.1
MEYQAGATEPGAQEKGKYEYEYPYVWLLTLNCRKLGVSAETNPTRGQLGMRVARYYILAHR